MDPRRTSLKAGLLLVLILTAAWVGNAQHTLREREALKFAKAVSVSRIEKGMPAERFDRWLRRLVGSRAKMSWEVNDCGEQTGTAADRGRDFPMCVEARAEGFDLAVTVVLGVGTFKKGVSRGRPDNRGQRIDVEGEEAEHPKDLADLRKRIREITGR